MYSSDVSAGDTILASQYVNLRRDVREANCDTATRYYVVPGVEFQPRQEGYTYDKGTTLYYGLNHHNETDGTMTFFCGVHLPHGAIVTSLKSYLHRSADDVTVNIQLTKLNPTDGSVSYMANTTINDLSGTGFVSGEDTTISDATIDNQNYSYFLGNVYQQPLGAATLSLLMVVITYTVSNMLP